MSLSVSVLLVLPTFLPPSSPFYCLCSSSPFFYFYATSTAGYLPSPIASFLSEPEECSSVPSLLTSISSGKTSPLPGSKGCLDLLRQTWLLPMFRSEMGCDTILANETWGKCAEGFLTPKRWFPFGLGVNCVWIRQLDPICSLIVKTVPTRAEWETEENLGLADIAAWLT